MVSIKFAVRFVALFGAFILPFNMRAESLGKTESDGFRIDLKKSDAKEGKLPKSVKQILKRLRQDVADKDNEWFWEHVGVSRDKAATLIRTIGPIAKRGNLTIYAFFEISPMAFSTDGYTHLVVHDSNKKQESANEIFEPLPHVSFMRFSSPETLAWFEDFGGATEPMLAVRKQYHNGSWNVLGLHYLRILQDLTWIELFKVAEERDDSIAERRMYDASCCGPQKAQNSKEDCIGLLNASLFGESDKKGARRISWKLMSGCPDSRFLVSKGILEKSKKGVFKVANIEVVRPEYKKVSNPFEYDFGPQ